MRQSVQRVVPHDRERVFDLVADVERYPSFLPLWSAARVLERDATGYRTRQGLGIGPAKLEFTSSTALHYPDRIIVNAEDGPVRQLRMLWEFEDRGPNRCKVALDLVVEVHSKMLQKLLMAAYGEMAPKLISSFEARARAVARGEIPPPPSAWPGAEPGAGAAAGPAASSPGCPGAPPRRAQERPR
ncbi:type II toxin-antitoxin system RatA family toxin [Roseospira goensis]|uniref:Coenzyme Q-binding protein COQ10 n=1 Tax=Roseospira goensis TaxID=391922 RepID=A0A7W6WKD5_9PROT|nr:type II toxin-antitoxin system RatA family toxin [Roseospira goensis]MBB4286005.1 coenzyme Q-binding protein COQ10 [Roseospira goensis]